MRRISLQKIKEVLRLRFLNNLSYRQVEVLSGTSRSSVAEYCRRFEIIPHTIDAALALDDEELDSLLHPEKKLRSRNDERPLPDMNYLHCELKRKGVTLLLLWQEHRETHPNGYGYTQFGEHYRRYASTINPSMRQIHYAGDKLFVDYSGGTIPIVDPITGEISKAQIFVCVLGASGYTFVHASPSQTTADFIDSHNRAFYFYGGVPNILVPDNLKAAVISNKKGKVQLNESYADMGRHYSVAILPARPYHPQDKSHVELGVKACQRWILARLRNHTFFSIDELNEAIGPLLDAYNAKVIRKLGKSRLEFFKQLDYPLLGALPVNGYIYREHRVATVGVDYHVQLGSNHYSVPYTYIKKQVDIWYSSGSITISYQGVVIAQHPRYDAPLHDSTLKEHMPLEHQYQYEAWNPKRILNWASSIGAHAVALMETIMTHKSHMVLGYKSCMAILSFSKHYGKEELNLACAKALELNIHTVKGVESILKHKGYLRINTASIPVNNLLNSHGNIRGSDYFQ